MRISEILLSMASKLENKENEVLVLAETNEMCLEKVAEACVKAASILKECANTVDLIEGSRKLSTWETKQLLQSFAATPFGNNIFGVELFDGEEKFAEAVGSAGELLFKLGTVELPDDVKISINIMAGQEGLDEIGKLATAFDMSGYDGMQKQASVIDELLLTIATDPSEYRKIKEAQQKQMDEVKKKYVDVREKLHEVWAVEDAKKAIEKSEFMKEKRPLEAPLSTRTCPNHPGALVQRVGEDRYQCSLGKEILDFKTGFKTDKGVIVPGGDVSEQTKLNLTNPREIFSTRPERLSENGLK